MNKYILPDWPAPLNIMAYTTNRFTGVDHPHRDDPALLSQTLGLPQNPIWLNQAHTNIALPANNIQPGDTADAVYTYDQNVVCAILTADCLPVLLTTQHGDFVAAIHAGWRGLASGVIENTLRHYSNPRDLLVWLGPAIGPDKFEVREDVVKAFTQADSEASTAFHKINSEQWLGNLYELAKQRLHRYGVNKIFGGNYCTYSDEESFFSYRRDGKMTGRMATIIWISK